jgi:SAM-dependent methyltransferase
MVAPSVLSQLPLLADPVRGRLLLLLEPRELAVGDLEAALQLPQSTVSRHLRALADAGWVTSRAEGTSRLYRAEVRALPPGRAELWSLVRAELEAGADARRDGERLRHVLAERHGRHGGFFDSAAGQWDALRGELFGDRPELLPLLGLLEREWTVGDLGAGTGHFALAAAPFVRRVVAVDGSAAMLDVARTRLAGVPNVELREGDLEALPIAGARLDLVLLGLALSYVSDPARAIREAARVLKPGGRLLVVDLRAHDRTDYRQSMGHLWLGFGEAQLLDWMAEAGLEARVSALPPDARAKGPLLFVADARKITGGRTRKSPKGARRNHTRNAR